MRFVRSRCLRAIYTVASVLLSVAVLAALVQAGKQYVWCRALQEAMPHSCCAGGASESATAPAVAEIAADCCQLRNVPLLDDWTPASRAADLEAPLVAVLPYIGSDAGLAAHSAAPAGRDPTMRTGPPQTRARAQLMVFRI